jgi:hypothetical protein
VAGEAQAPATGRTGRTGRTAWIVAVCLTVLLIVLLVVALATGGDDSSSESSSSGAESQANAGSQGYLTFGDEASSADRAAAATAVQSFLRARANGDIAKQCALMAATAKKALQEFGGGLTEKHQPCPELMEAVNARINQKAVRGPGQIRVTAVRVDGDRGFVIYKDADGKTSAFSVVREGSSWKAGALNGYPVG